MMSKFKVGDCAKFELESIGNRYFLILDKYEKSGFLVYDLLTFHKFEILKGLKLDNLEEVTKIKISELWEG